MATKGLCVMITSLALGEDRVRQALRFARVAADEGIPTTVVCVGDGVRLCDCEYAGELVRYREAFRKSGGTILVFDLSVPENELDWEDIIATATVADLDEIVALLKAGAQFVVF